ncbi:MAG TPA: hypothetical protein VMU75_09100 [Acidimicrobiales bacterium]|nr:hypothetical protein [Acidimicrobiales bacterium]
MKRALAAVLVALSCAAGLGAGTVTASGATRVGWTGYGAKLAAWRVARPRATSGCPLGHCYGPRVDYAGQTYEFESVTTSAGRVSGYTQALRPGTTLAQAEVEVLALFPADLEPSTLKVQRRDTYGGSCAFLNVSSKTLRRLFGPKAFGGASGTVGIELSTATASGRSVLRRANIDQVLVSPIPWSPNDSC